MRAQESLRPWGLRVAAFATCYLFSILPANADVVKTGTDSIPGYPGKNVVWRAGYSKSPYGNPVGAKSIHFWYDLKLDSPQPEDDVYFVICAMINVNRPKFNQPSYKVNLVGNQWTCKAAGSVDWYPNYHFGCKRIHLWAGNNWHDNTSFDQTVTLSVAFDEKDLVAPYLDIARDCPGGFSGCDGVFPGQDRFMTPGDGLFPGSPNGTSSWWIVTKGVPSGPIQPGIAGWNAGNWYTMGYMFNTYRSQLAGTLLNAPAGSLVEFTFPPSSGAEPQRYLVTGDGCFGDPLDVSIPFTITEGLMHDPDENIYMRIFLGTPCPQYPSGEVIEFQGQVMATDFSYFPTGDILYSPGDFMHGIHAQFVADYDPPFVVDQQLTQISAEGIYQIRVSAADATTMAIGATLSYTVNGVEMPDFPIPFDDPSESNGMTLFRGNIGPFRPGSQISYWIRLVDDAGNMSVTTGTGGTPAAR